MRFESSIHAQGVPHNREKRSAQLNTHVLYVIIFQHCDPRRYLGSEKNDGIWPSDRKKGSSVKNSNESRVWQKIYLRKWNFWQYLGHLTHFFITSSCVYTNFLSTFSLKVSRWYKFSQTISWVTILTLLSFIWMEVIEKVSSPAERTELGVKIRYSEFSCTKLGVNLFCVWEFKTPILCLLNMYRTFH